MLTTITNSVDEESSYDISFDCFESDGITVLPPSNVKVYIFVTGQITNSPWVNDRDGTDSTGLSVDGNSVTFHLSPDDNKIVDRSKYAKSGYESHTVRFEVFYNSDSDKYYLDLVLRVRDLAHIPPAV